MSSLANGRMVPFVWSDGTMTRLGTLEGVGPPFSSVTAIDDGGRIIGDSYLTVAGHTRVHAVLWKRRTSG
jgi:uncharacterized membrane protein